MKDRYDRLILRFTGVIIYLKYTCDKFLTFFYLLHPTCLNIHIKIVQKIVRTSCRVSPKRSSETNSDENRGFSSAKLQTQTRASKKNYIF